MTRGTRLDRGRFLTIAVGLYGLLAVVPALFGGGGPRGSLPRDEGCLSCHEGIEAMHPEAQLSCVDCHGGDPEARTTKLAHVQPAGDPPGDERTLPLGYDPAWVQFVNPMDMRIVHKTCGECHSDLCEDLELSLHGTTAGHVSDGFYEMGLVDEPGSRYSVFSISDRNAEPGGLVDALLQAPEFEARKADPTDIGTYFPDLVRKECMQCHLYSEGRAVRGRLGFDGDYRGSGCAACHVAYATNGLSDSADRTVDKTEPGHPLRHEMTRAPTTNTCTSCHYGDASIGLHFRGLSQLPPGAPGGPDIPGTTDTLLNRTFYLDDPEICPPDVHHERGMHCIDCHTLGDVMGDGRLHGQMEHAVEISCEACHGDFESRTDFRTERGTPLTNLFEEDGRVWLRSKVTGERHPVKQVVDILDAAHPDHHPRAAEAMTAVHGELECYTCHAGWNVNFLGFHFYRNESLSQLDILSGKRTPGRVTTQEKVFATWKSFYAGMNETGRFAPYLTGFSTMGTVDDEEGRRILDQAMPVTAEGLSGVTMVHHQLHSTRPTARSCVECHRSSTTWGMGSANFRLARQLAFVADRRGIEVVALERGQLASSTPLAKLVLPDVVDMELLCDPLQGHAEFLFAAEGGRGIHVIDVREPTRPRRVAFVASVGPRGMALAGDYLLSADGVGGLRVYDVSEPSEIERVAVLPMFDAHDVEVRWPWAYVADGPGGLSIVDVRAPISPRLVSTLTLEASDGLDDAVDLDLLFQYSRPEVDFDDDPAPFRTDARHLCAVLDRNGGPILVDVTEPTRPVKLWPGGGQRGRTQARGREGWEYRGLALRSKVDLATPQGGTPTSERDYLYVVEERILANGDSRSFIRSVDVSEPSRPRQAGRVETGDQTEMLAHGSFFNTPFLQPVAMVPGDDGVYLTDLSLSEELAQLGTLQALRSCYVVALEEFPLDRMIDEDGDRLKDVSRRPSRWLYRAEIERILDVSAAALGLDEGEPLPEVPGSSARRFFQRQDRDRDGLLTGEELEGAGGASADLNGDGRIILAELAEFGSRFVEEETRVVEEEQQIFLESRVDANGDLARLFDGLDPREFDRNGDHRLDRKELSKALFSALDLNGDERLGMDELSRHPGPLRRLRFGDATALQDFGLRDLNRGGSISRRELSVRDAEWESLDLDGDGFIQLPVSVDRRSRNQGLAPPPSEWPTRQPQRSSLPPVVTVDGILAALDLDGDGQLGKRELRDREDLSRELDGNADGLVSAEELGRAVARIQGGGVEVTRDGFLERWDLDGDGEVGEGELPAPVLWLLERRSN